MDPLTALAALLPLGIEAGRAAIQRFIVPDHIKPATHEDAMTARRIDLEFFQSMQGGQGGGAPAWVEAVRQLQRPAFAAAVIAVWAFQAAGTGVTPGVENMAAAVGFYLFGDRSLFYIRGGK